MAFSPRLTTLRMTLSPRLTITMHAYRHMRDLERTSLHVLDYEFGPDTSPQRRRVVESCLRPWLAPGTSYRQAWSALEQKLGEGGGAADASPTTASSSRGGAGVATSEAALDDSPVTSSRNTVDTAVSAPFGGRDDAMWSVEQSSSYRMTTATGDRSTEDGPPSTPGSVRESRRGSLEANAAIRKQSTALTFNADI